MNWRIEKVRLFVKNAVYLGRIRAGRSFLNRLFNRKSGFCSCGAFVSWREHRTQNCPNHLRRQNDQLRREVDDLKSKLLDHRDWQRAAAIRMALIEDKYGKLKRLDDGTATVVNGRLSGLSTRLNELDGQFKAMCGDVRSWRAAETSYPQMIAQINDRLNELTDRVYVAEQVEEGHAEAVVVRLKMLRERVSNAHKRIDEVETQVSVEGAVATLGMAPARKVDQLAARYKIIRAYVRGISERMRALERNAGISPTLDGPQRVRDQACELLIDVLEQCKEDSLPPIIPTRIVSFLDASGYDGWSQE